MVAYEFVVEMMDGEDIEDHHHYDQLSELLHDLDRNYFGCNDLQFALIRDEWDRDGNLIERHYAYFTPGICCPINFVNESYDVNNAGSVYCAIPKKIRKMFA